MTTTQSRFEPYRPQYARHGEHNGRSQISREDVDTIREAVRNRDRMRREAVQLRERAKALERFAAKLTNVRLAKRLGVSEGAVRGVIYGTTWATARDVTVGSVERYGFQPSTRVQNRAEAGG